MRGKQKAFCRLPKILFSDNNLYSALSVGATIIYCYMLDRLSLSKSNLNDWTDSKGEVYIYFGRSEVEYFAKCKHDKASAILKELESCKLIRREHQGLGLPDRIYVLDLLAAPSDYTTNINVSSYKSCDDAKSDGLPTRNPTSSELNIWTASGGASDTNNTIINKNDVRNTHTNKQMDKLSEHIKEIIKYEYLCMDFPVNQVNFLVKIICDTVACSDDTIYIAGATHEGDYVRSCLTNMNYNEARYALNLYGSETDTIRSPKYYLLARIWEAQAGAMLSDVIGKPYRSNKDSAVTPSGELGDSEIEAIHRLFR